MSDFCALDPMDQESAVEMDAVVGRQGKDRKCVLTLFIRRIGFQFCIPLPGKSGASVVAALDSLQDLRGPRFSTLFGVIPTDRGSEFADVDRIEHGRNGAAHLRLYCSTPTDPSRREGRSATTKS